MIIEYLEFSNIYRYSGKERFEFPCDNSSNLSVIIGRSNAGKSTLIKGLKLLLYGVNGRGLSEEDALDCINREAIRQARAGTKIEAYVKAKFCSGSTRKTMVRHIVVQRKYAHALDIDFVEESPELILHTGIRDIPETDPAKINQMLIQVVPPSLFNFYFFQGEEVAKELLRPKVDQSISSALLDVFYKSDWTRALSDLQEVKRLFAKKRQESAGENKQLRKLGDEKDELTEKKDRLTEELGRQIEHVGKLRKQYEECDQQFLATYDNEKEHQHILDLREQEKLSGRNADEQLEQLRRLIGSDGHLAFLDKAFTSAAHTLEGLRKQGRLPPDISGDLVKRLLREKRCICETNLDDNKAANQAIEKLQQICMSASLGRDLSSLYDSISSEESGLRLDAKTLGSRLAKIRKKHQEALNTHTKILEELRVAETRHDTNAYARREALRRKRDELNVQVQHQGAGVHRIENELKRIDSRLSEIGNELRRVRNVPAEAVKWQACEEMAEKLAGYISQFQMNLLQYCHQRLQHLTAEMYNETVNDGSKAWINSDTLLPAIRLGERTGGAWGGGQSQVLILSYICALSELRKEVCERMRELFDVNLVNDQCFFMDCVFGAMEPMYQAGVSKSLRGKMKQLVLLFNPTQWTQAISEELQGHIHQAYALRNSVTQQESDPYQHVLFYGRNIPLSFPQEKDTESVTKVENIKL